MSERTLHENRYYKISLREKIILFGMRFTILPYLTLRYKLRRWIPTDLASGADVFQRYIPKHELPLVMKWLNLKGDDAITAIKALTYFHTLTGVTGEIVEMTPERAVRVETACPAAKYVDQDFCQNTMSCPAFTAVAQTINPDLIHRHDLYLSGGDDSCTMIFEMKGDVEDGE